MARLLLGKNVGGLSGTGTDPAPDIRLIQNLTLSQYQVTVDWNLLNDGTLDDSQALATAIIVALGTDGLASTDDQLPDPDSSDRAGWWGNLDAQELWGGWDIGTKLWLMKRSAIEGPNAQRGATLARVKNYIYECIQPFVTNRIASTFTVEVQRVSDQQINALIRIYRGPIPAIDLRYAILWTDIRPEASIF
jgi:phage gp46-like protein